MSVVFREGDLLTVTDVDVICHQCNCLTVKSHGLSQAIAQRFAWADVYGQRPAVKGRNLTSEPATPGTIKVFSGLPGIVCLFGQWDFGRGKYRKIGPYDDSAENRLLWFQSCLDHLGTLTRVTRVAMPYRIGCGMAGGHWPSYYGLIQNFARTYDKHVIIIVRNGKGRS